MLKKWKCQHCGYVVEGEMPPVKCPNCGHDQTEFKLLEDEE